MTTRSIPDSGATPLARRLCAQPTTPGHCHSVGDSQRAWPREDHNTMSSGRHSVGWFVPWVRHPSSRTPSAACLGARRLAHRAPSPPCVCAQEQCCSREPVDCARAAVPTRDGGRRGRRAHGRRVHDGRGRRGRHGRRERAARGCHTRAGPTPSLCSPQRGATRPQAPAPTPLARPPFSPRDEPFRRGFYLLHAP